jgi:phosphatidylserine decarboxylase
VLAALVPGVIAATAGWLWVAGALGVAALFFAYFFRDPSRVIASDPSAIVSPADGRVMVAGPGQSGVAPPGEWTQVSIFLSPLDVHINRIPSGGRVTRVHFTPGQFLAAYRADAAARNERNEIWIEANGRVVVCRQVVGVVARRLVCRVGEGAEVRTGDKYGLMKFGSRIDLFFPTSATLATKVGDVVRGGETVLARWPQ